MMMHPELSTATIDSLAREYAKHGSGLATIPKEAPLSSIYTAPRVFQPRDKGLDEPRHNEHVDQLAREIKRRRKLLDPIVVFPIAGRLFVCDGHCRIAAYEKAGWTRPIRFSVFAGTFEQAVDFTFTANSKNKLPLLNQEKTERAWKALLLARAPLALAEAKGEAADGRQPSLTGIIKGIAAKTGAAERTVWNMLEELKTPRTFDHRALTWREVKRERKRPSGDYEKIPQSDREVLTQEIGHECREVVKAAVARYVRNIQEPKRGLSKGERNEIVAEALQAYFSQSVGILIEDARAAEEDDDD